MFNVERSTLDVRCSTLNIQHATFNAGRRIIPRSAFRVPRLTVERTPDSQPLQFLRERGLKLSEEKTLITHIAEGFNFLGQRVRKYGNKLLIRPTRQSVRSVLEKARQRIRSCRGLPAAVLIRKLNPLLRGWANYHRHVASKRTFARVGHCVRTMLWRWVRRNHPNKSCGWIKRHYYAADEKGAFSIWTHDARESGVCCAPILWRGPLSSATSRFEEKPTRTSLKTSSILRDGNVLPGGLIRREKPVHFKPGGIG